MGTSGERGARTGCGWGRLLDRIPVAMYERTLRLHRREHEQLARRSAALDFRERVADLKERIARKRALDAASILEVCDEPAIRAA